MTSGRRARALAGVGVLAVLFGALTTVAPVVGATEGNGAHAVEHNADLNPNQRGTNFESSLGEDCEDLPEEVAGEDFVWHFVTEGQDTFERLDIEFQTDGLISDADFVAHPSAKHAYVSTSTRDTLLDATATVAPGPEGDDVATFQLSHTCDLSDQPEEGAGDDNSLTVVKAVDEDAPESWEFEFSGNVTEGSFLLGDTDADRTFDELADGEYDVTEAAHDGVELTGIDCEVTGGGETDFSVDGREVTVDLEDGEDVTCTFTNDFPTLGGGGETPTTETPTTGTGDEDEEVLGDQEERETTETEVTEETAPTTETVEVEVEAEDEERAPTTETEVRGEVQQRTALPRTGNASQALTLAGIGLVALGAAMASGGRRRLGRIG